MKDFFKWGIIIEDFKRVGNLEVDIDRLMRSRTIGYKIDERFLKRLVGSISKWQVVDDIELMISVRSEMLKQEKEDRESVASFVKVGRLLLLLFKDRMELILSEI